MARFKQENTGSLSAMPTYFRGQKVSRLVLRFDDVGTITEAKEVLQEQLQTVRNLNREARQIAEEITSRFLLPMLDELKQYPPRKLGMKINWTSPNQRKYVMMLLRAQAIERGIENPTGRDLAYERTGELGRKWQAVAEVSTGQKGIIRLRTWNDAKRYDPIKKKSREYERFVQGGIGTGLSRRSIRRYEKPIQQFHTDREWPVAYPIIQRYYREAREFALERYGAKLSLFMGEG